MKLIVLSPFVYYPGVPHGGGALCWGQLEGLAQKHEIHFIAFAPADSSELAIALSHLDRICKSVTTVHQPLGKLTILRAKIALLLQRIPVGVNICKAAPMKVTLMAALARQKPDAVLVQFPQMAQYVDVCQGYPTLMDVQDAYSVSTYRQYRTQGSHLKRLQGFLNWIGWVSYEALYYPRFSVVTTLTEQDRLGLEVFSPGLCALTSPAAVKIPAVQWRPAGQPTIAYIGSFSHPPNVAALIFFIQEVLPIVLKSCPDAVFEVAGKGVPAAVVAMASSSIKFVGMVPDAFEFLAGASVVAIPLLSGGGIKIKSLEAMACGCPVVTTSIGAEETGAVDGEHFLIADDANSFAAAVVRLLQDQSLAARLGNKARAHIEGRFSWAAKWVSLTQLLDLAVARKGQR